MSQVLYIFDISKAQFTLEFRIGSITFFMTKLFFFSFILLAKLTQYHVTSLIIRPWWMVPSYGDISHFCNNKRYVGFGCLVVQNELPCR